MSRVSRPLANWLLIGVPLFAVVTLVWAWVAHPPTPVLIVLGILLVGAVFTAVHHAEVIAVRVGEPFGSLVLAVAVTVAEVGMIVTLMLSSPETTTTLARDTVFSALMLICNGIVGISLILKALKRRTAVFTPDGVGGALAAITVLATLTMVFPVFTHSAPGASFAPLQLGFVATVSLVLYSVFIFVQTIRHREFFLPPQISGAARGLNDGHGPLPSTKATLISLGLLLASLIAVVGLSKVTSPVLKAGISALGLPAGMVAVAIAVIVLLPESISAIRAALHGRSQTSLNLAYGSAMASIGLTIPVIAVISLTFGFPIVLGLSPSDMVLLALTMVVSILTVLPGKATVLQGAIHLCILGSFLVFVISP